MIPQENRIWIGVDWGDRAHTVCVLDDAGAVLLKKVVPHSPAGLRDMTGAVSALGPVGGAAIEDAQGLAGQALLAEGWPVYCINPKLSYAWRKAWSVSEAKTDGRDAHMLADGLRQQHARLRPVPAVPAAIRGLALLCEDERRLIAQRTALVQQLQAALKRYFPVALAYFDNWTSPSAWDFLLTFPTPESLARATTRKLMGFFKTHRLALTPARQAQIQDRARALDWHVAPEVVEVKARLAQTTAKLLRTLQSQLDEYRKVIETAAAAQPQTALVASLPGAGAKLAPRLLAHILPILDQCASADSLMMLGGVSPVLFESGKHKRVRMRHACQKGFRATLHLFAAQSACWCAWARAFYDLARQRGQSHALALRNLARKWLKILFRMLKTNTPYDEELYLKQLHLKNPALTKYMDSAKAGG